MHSILRDIATYSVVGISVWRVSMASASLYFETYLQYIDRESHFLDFIWDIQLPVWLWDPGAPKSFSENGVYDSHIKKWLKARSPE